jgi:hypothetical protein
VYDDLINGKQGDTAMIFYVVHSAMPNVRIKSYPTERGAKIARTRFNRNAGFDAYRVVTQAECEANDRMVTVSNLMSGNPVEIRESVRGTACDPGMESYWSA